MCLILEVQTKGISRLDAGKISKGAKKLNGFDLLAQRVPKGTVGSSFWIASSGEHCACKLLHEKADTEGPEISLDGRFVKDLDITLRYFAKHAGDRGFTFRAAYVSGAWSEYQPRERRPVTFNQLLSAIRECRIASNVLFEVAGAAAEHAH